MKEMEFISYENVVNRAFPEINFIFGEHSSGDNATVLLIATDKKNRFNSKINIVVNHSSFFSKNFEVTPKEISIRINK